MRTKMIIFFINSLGKYVNNMQDKEIMAER